IFIFNSIYYRSIGQNKQFFSLKSNVLSSFFVILLFIVYVLIGGDRGPALTVILMLAFGYVLLNKMRIKVTTFMMGILFVVFMNFTFTFIEILRLNDSSQLDINTIQTVAAKHKDYETIPGITIRCTSLAIEGIETNLYPHTYGFFLLQSLVKGVPYFGNLLIEEFIDEDSIISNGSAHLLTIQNSGRFYNSGIGTSYLADMFIEFGVIGVVLISFIFGLVIGKFELK